MVMCERIRGSEYKLIHSKFYLNIRKIFFIVRVIKNWSRLPREVVDSPFLEIFIPNWTSP